jgi:acetyltransferase-like isoleucine patch superfamily enzyme
MEGQGGEEAKEQPARTGMRKLLEKIRWILRGFKRTLLFLSQFWDDRYYTQVDMDRWRALGAKIGKDVQIQHIKVDERFARLLEIDDEANIAEGTNIVLHDSSLNNLFGEECPVKFGKVRIGKAAYIGRNAIILCGVRIGDYALIGAGALVVNDVPDYGVAMGVPAKIVGDTRDLKEKQKKQIEEQENSPFRFLRIKRWHERHKIMTNDEVEEAYQAFFKKVGW